MKEPSGWMNFGLAVGALLATMVTTFVDFRAEQRESTADQRDSARMAAEAIGVLSEAIELEASGRQILVKNDIDLALIPRLVTDLCVFESVDDSKQQLFQQQRRDTQTCDDALRGIHGVLKSAALMHTFAPQQLQTAHAARLLSHTCHVGATSAQARIEQVRNIVLECNKIQPESFADYANCPYCRVQVLSATPNDPTDGAAPRA